MFNSKNFTIKRVQNLEEVRSLGKRLQSALEVEVVAVRYLNESELWAVFENEEIKYMLEIREKRILQFRASRNGPPTAEDNKEVTETLKQEGVIA